MNGAGGVETFTFDQLKDAVRGTAAAVAGRAFHGFPAVAPLKLGVGPRHLSRRCLVSTASQPWPH